MSRTLPAIKIFIFLFLIISCNRSAVELSFTNAEGEVPRLGNLVFRFSKALVPDSLLNEWDSSKLVVFTPAIEGRFRWEHADELVFSPARPLPPATSFTGKVSSGVLANSTMGSVSGKDLSFHTPGLALEDLYTTWLVQDESSRTAVPQVELYFNYAVDPAVLKEKLRILIDGKPLTYTLQTLSKDSRISVRLQGIKPVDRNLEAKVLIASGLLPEGGSQATTGEMDAKLSIPSPFNLVVNQVDAEHNGLAGTIAIHTSQQIRDEALMKSIKLSPAVKFTAEPTDNGILIRSEDFDADKSYVVTLSKGLHGVAGGVLQEEYEQNIAFGELEPSIRFATSKNVYLGSRGNRSIEMNIVNVPRIRLVVSKIYENNLLGAQRYGYYPSEKTDNEQDDYYASYGNDDWQAGDVILEQEIDTRTLPQLGNSRLLRFDVEDKLPDTKGIYHIRVRSAKDYWLSDSRFISLSDLGLIAKEGQDKLFVFANSIKTAEAVPGVNVIAYGSNNQVLGRGPTNKDGVAEIAYTRKEFAGYKPAMVVASLAGDFNYLPFGKMRVNTSRFEIGGKKINNTGLDAFIYAERDIYRPGEAVNFSVIVRDRTWQTPAGLPMKLRFLLPNGKELKAFRKTLNEQGSCEGTIGVDGAAITGTYTLEVYSSNDVLLGSKNFSIEEFVPDRIKVSATLDQSFLIPGKNAVLSIHAQNFFGPPAANRNYEAEIQVRAKNFSPKKFQRYNFAIQNQGLSLDKVVRQGRTDDSGNASEKYETPGLFANSGLLQANFYATVFDETGRPVSRNTTVDIFTQPVFFGLLEDDNWYYPLNQPAQFRIVALNKDQQVLQGAKAQVRMIRREYRTVLARSGSYFRYESQESDKILSDQTISVGGENTVYNFVPRAPGNYEIRISLPGATGYVSKTFYSYGAWGGDNNSFEVDQEGNIDIELDKTAYKAGDKARVLFKAPFSGRMLVTIESDKVLSYRYVDVEKRNASIDLAISDAYRPNVFVTATLIKPHGISDIPLTVAHGFQNLMVEDRSRINPVKITAVASTRSKTLQQVIVTAAPGSFVTLAAVDNGVLQVTDFKTPDPYHHFYAPRALDVNAYDLYPYLYPELRGRLSSTGGDGEADMLKRVNPMPAKRVNILSYWSGIARASGDGQAKFDVNIPAFSGQVRLMAVAYKDAVFGSAESAMTVADPLVLSTAVPRFLSPGDSIAVPVTISNTTGRAAAVTARISTSGPLNVQGPVQQALDLSGNKEGRLMFSLTASPQVDTGRIVVEAKALGETFTEQIAIGVRPASAWRVSTGSGSVAGGKTSILRLRDSNLIPASARYRLLISRNPLLEAAAPLQYLLNYPYGCTEQVVSAAFPQLYFTSMAASVKGAGYSESQANENILAAIRTIALRQLYNGSLTLWEGEGTEHWWASAYAAHFLLEAKKAGFEVEEKLLSGLLNYLNSRLRNKQMIAYAYNRTENKKIAPKETAYSLYVLALAGQSNVPAMNYYKNNPEWLSLDSKYLLSAAYAVAGDRQRFRELLPPSFSGEVSVPQTGGSFYSPVRDESIALNALLEVDPGNAQVPVMARHVAEQLKSRRWYSTQECAFSFLALGKLAKASAGSTVTADITAGGKRLAAFDGENLSLTKAQLGQGEVSINTSGQGNLYYFWQREGIGASPDLRDEDSYLRVRRSFFDRYGRKLTGNQFKQNDLVIVRLELEKMYEGDVDNIVITDLLPAGFEIENPRTKEIPGMEWIDNAAEPTHLDVRDDRINLFADLTNPRQVYYYAVRAVSPGVFTLGAVAAEAMYNGEYHSHHGAGKIRIVE